jgi:undecaprenyl-diphosphatase
MLVITYFGSVTTTITVTALSSLSFYIHKQKTEVVRLLVSVCGSSLSVLFIKAVVAAPRPIEEALYSEITSSFPSGHATIAMSLYGFLLWHVHKQKKQRFKTLLIATLAILIILLGVSRLYLGVHYLSEVLVGYIVGFIWLSVSLGILRPKS